MKLLARVPVPVDLCLLPVSRQLRIDTLHDSPLLSGPREGPQKVSGLGPVDDYAVEVRGQLLCLFGLGAV